MPDRQTHERQTHEHQTHEHRTSGHDTQQAHAPHGTDQPDSTDPAVFWEEFYGPGRRPWSGRPNALLVEELASRPLTPATVLDLGSGTGGDALWFAGLGWTVTGVDLSATALAIAAQAADEEGRASTITFLRCDLTTDFPTGSWDLVVASYLQSPVALDRDLVLRRAAAAVAPGGTLLVLGHERFPASHQSALTELPTTFDVLASLDLTGWTVVRAEPVAVQHASADSGHDERFDHVIRIRKNPR
ncbi:class I SAM-dependent methyltransferase [Microlunatus aurantiacus]|uniref:Class I SAM-dependent methyltransferase n=1 Tax=Microlunatus aurantiacus TaxID=446786 RepID=A0ABP7CTL5_9ACTN